MSGQKFVTVGTEELLFIQSIENEDKVLIDSLVKVKIGQRATSDKNMEILVGYASLKANNKHSILTLSKNGAFLALGNKKCLILLYDRVGGYICSHCSCLFGTGPKCKEHSNSMHMGPMKCERCGDFQEDRKMYIMHLQL